MTFTTQTHPVQQLNNGQYLDIISYSLDSQLPGPEIYLQANLHGPEIFGTYLLGQIIKSFKNELPQTKGFVGSIIIVPCANPVAAQNMAYNSMQGRWNPISGNNWNRIFATQSFDSLADKITFYKTQLQNSNLSIEYRLAAELMILSGQADYIIDIHTTGLETVNHFFAHPDHTKYFEALEPDLVIQTTNIPLSPSFENACVWPVMNSNDRPPIACTWEASNNSVIDNKQIEQQGQRLWTWLQQVWSREFQLSFDPKVTLDDTSCDHLVAPAGGYFVWLKDIGEIIYKGEVYGNFYQPKFGQFVSAGAEFDFILIGKYGIGAIAAGEQIAWIGRL